MEKHINLASQFMQIRRSLPYVKFDKEISNKSKHEICILSYLKLHNGEAHPRDLSEEFLISTARMAVLLNQLEEKEYIKRVPDSDDNRQTIIKLQPKGNDFFEEANDKILEFIARFFDELGTEDSEEFVRLHTKLMDFVSKRI